MVGPISTAPLREDPLQRQSASPEITLRSAALTSGLDKLLDMPGVISDAGDKQAPPAPDPEGSPPQPPSRRRFARPPTSAGIFFYLISVGLVAIATIAVFFGTGFLLLVEPARGTLSGGLQNFGTHLLVHDPLPAVSGDQRPAGGTLGAIAAQSDVSGPAGTTASSVVPVAPPPAANELPPPKKDEPARNSTALPPAPEVPKNVAEGNVPSSTPAEPPTAKPMSTTPMRLPAPSGDQQTADGTPGAIAAQSEMPGSAETTASSVVSIAPPAADESPPPEKDQAARNSTALPPTPEVPKNVAEGNVAPSTDMPAEPPTAQPANTAAMQSVAMPEPAPTSLAAPTAASPSPHLSAAEISDLVGQGDAHLRTGDLASARLFYERAAVAGDGRAALRLAATFDPNFLGRAGLRNARGDVAEARLWYSRALELGAAEAKYWLESLDTKQGR